MIKTFEEEYLKAVRRKLEKQGKSEEQIEEYISGMMGYTEAEVMEVPNEDVVIRGGRFTGEVNPEVLKELTVKLRFCEFCDSKGVKHKKVCPTLKEGSQS